MLNVAFVRAPRGPDAALTDALGTDVTGADAEGPFPGSFGYLGSLGPRKTLNLSASDKHITLIP